jgi:hypothetical protein
VLENNRNKPYWLFFALRHGATLNKMEVYQHQGKQYGMEKQHSVMETYRHFEQLGRGRMSLTKITLDLKVYWWFVQKIESEPYTNDGCVILPEEVTLDKVSQQQLGSGSILF